MLELHVRAEKMLCIVLVGCRSMLMEHSQIKPAWMHVVVLITLIVVQEMGLEKKPLQAMVGAIHTSKMHVITLLAVCVKMVAVWALMVSAPVAVLLITAQYIVLLNISLRFFA